MIVYLYGFSSGPASAKASALRRALWPSEVVVPAYPSQDPDAAVAALSGTIDTIVSRCEEPDLMLIGSSLGGFYAQYLGATRIEVKKVVLINPALQPRLTLAPFVGTNINMVTGEEFTFSRTNLDALAHYELTPHAVVAPTLVLLDAADELIDSRVAAARYRGIGRVIVYPGGSHRFEHVDDAAPEVASFYEKNGE